MCLLLYIIFSIYYKHPSYLHCGKADISQETIEGKLNAIKHPCIIPN